MSNLQVGKVRPRSTQGRPMVGPRAAQGLRKVHPRSAQGRPRVGPRSTQGWVSVAHKLGSALKTCKLSNELYCEWSARELDVHKTGYFRTTGQHTHEKRNTAFEHKKKNNKNHNTIFDDPRFFPNTVLNTFLEKRFCWSGTLF